MVLGRDEGHAFRYLPGENDSTVWPGNLQTARIENLTIQ